MKPLSSLLGWAMLLSAALTGCDALSAIAPAPAATVAPTATSPPEPTATIMPTLGPREFLDAAFCWESHVDVGEFEILRFFPDGTIIDVFVQPFADCQDAWQNMAGYLSTGRWIGIPLIAGGLLTLLVALALSATVTGLLAGGILSETPELLRFRWYVNGMHKLTARLASVGPGKRLIPDSDGQSKTAQLFAEFFQTCENYSAMWAKNSTARRLRPFWTISLRCSRAPICAKFSRTSAGAPTPKTRSSTSTRPSSRLTTRSCARAGECITRRSRSSNSSSTRWTAC